MIMKLGFFCVLAILVLPSSGIQIQASVQLNQEIQTYDLLLKENIPIRFWRADPSVFNITESNIFPIAALNAQGSFANLGKAWITWTMDFQGQVIGAYALFNRGRISNFNFINKLYDDISWFALETALVMIKVGEGITSFSIITENDPVVTHREEFLSRDHQIYATPDGFQVFMYANNTDPIFLTGTGTDQISLLLSLETRSTDEIILSSIPGMALFESATGKLEIKSIFGNSSVPSSDILGVEFSNNSVIGHYFLEPTIYDVSIGKMWYPSLGTTTVDLPKNSKAVFPFGLGSSIVQTQNNTIYERRDAGWIEIGHSPLSTNIQTVSIVDIGLYLSTIIASGLNFLAMGVDEEADFVPDTLEDYYFTLPNKSDTDDDTIPDIVEIAYGTNPLIDDRLLDDDGDGMNNIDELNIALDPGNSDTDFGGATDGWEVNFDYNPLNATDDQFDEDGDGLINGIESVWNSDPRKTDTDGDGIPDDWEVKFELDPTDPGNALEDPDHDGKSNLEEYKNDTDPLVPTPKALFEGLWIWFLLVSIIIIPVTYKVQKSYLK